MKTLTNSPVIHEQKNKHIEIDVFPYRKKEPPNRLAYFDVIIKLVEDSNNQSRLSGTPSRIPLPFYMLKSAINFNSINARIFKQQENGKLSAMQSKAGVDFMSAADQHLSTQIWRYPTSKIKDTSADLDSQTNMLSEVSRKINNELSSEVSIDKYRSKPNSKRLKTKQTEFDSLNNLPRQYPFIQEAYSTTSVQANDLSISNGQTPDTEQALLRQPSLNVSLAKKPDPVPIIDIGQQLAELISRSAGNTIETQELKRKIKLLNTSFAAKKREHLRLQQRSNTDPSLFNHELRQQQTSLLNKRNFKDKVKITPLLKKTQTQQLHAKEQNSQLSSKLNETAASNQTLTHQLSDSHNGWKFALTASIAGLIAAIVAGLVTLAKAFSHQYEEEGDAAQAEALVDFIQADQERYHDPNTSAEEKLAIADRYIKQTNNNGDSVPDFNPNSMLSKGEEAAAPTLKAARANAIKTAREREQKGPAVGLGLGGILSLAGIVGSSIMLLKTKHKTPKITVNKLT